MNSRTLRLFLLPRLLCRHDPGPTTRIPLGSRRMVSTLERPEDSSVPHTERTAAEPRQNRLYKVRLSHVREVNSKVRLIRLAIPRDESDRVDGAEVRGFCTIWLTLRTIQLAYMIVVCVHFVLQAGQSGHFTFSPGQWLDVYIPSIPRAGGFTITSTPADARTIPIAPPATEESFSAEREEDEAEDLPLDYLGQGREPYVELAVQDSPSNPPAAWLWRPVNQILGKELNVRVGGSFVWPPSGYDLGEIRNVVFVAGGVGVK